jgi:hypothetical protein
MIKELSIRRNEFGDDGAISIAELIEGNPQKFVYLEMSRNKVTDVGASKIYEAMKINTRLKSLLIDYGNKITDRKVIAGI